MAKNVVALDVGSVRIGVAGSDALGITAQAIETWTRRGLQNDLTHIAQIASDRKAEAFVLGLPRNMDGTEGSRCVKSRRFAARLATACGVPVVLWDERRTTVTAAGILSANSTFGADRKARLDSVSAAVILESFLAWRKAHPGEEPPEVAAPTAPEQA